MFDIKKILVAVDCSPGSRLALQHGLSLAAKHGAKLQVLHVAEVPSFKPEPRVQGEEGTSTLDEYAVKRGRRQLEAFLASVQAEPRFEVEVAAGRPRDVILERAGSGGYDLIVMGTQGLTGRPHSLAGSVAESVVRSAPCPVLTVRERG